MKTLKLLLPVFALLFCFNFVSAQEMTAEKYDNLEWYNIHYVKFEDGKAEDAKKIIDEYFKPSAQDAGQQGPVMELDLLFSEWDHVVIFPMEEGVEALEWKTSPMNVAWMKAFQERAGSEERAKEIGDEFDSYIKEYKNQLARKTN